MASITDWNVIPNKQYFVKLIDAGTFVKAFFYNTEAYMNAGTHLVASGTCGYGSDREMTLSNKAEYPSIDYFNNTKTYHLKVTFTQSESDTSFKVGPFYDKDINEILCHSADIQTARAQAEINKGTHSLDIKSLLIGSHDPDVRDGLVVTLNTTAISNQTNMVKKATIRGSEGGLILDELELYSLEDLSLY